MCYTPSDETDCTLKEEFLNQLQKTYLSQCEHGMKIVLGDLNAKVDKDSSIWSRTTGKNGTGKINENGQSKNIQVLL